MVLERSEYPEGFSQQFHLACVPESKELVIEYELPLPEIIPTAAEFRYVKVRM
jgi:restriction system protein